VRLALISLEEPRTRDDHLHPSRSGNLRHPLLKE
jgi:hypothetical protein